MTEQFSPDVMLKFMKSALQTPGMAEVFKQYLKPMIVEASIEGLQDRHQSWQQEQQEEQQRAQQENYNSRLGEHQGSMREAIEADPQFGELLQKRNMPPEMMDWLTEKLMGYDQAPATLKNLLQGDHDFDKMDNKQWNSAFAKAHASALPQDQQQPQVGQQQGQPDKPVKLPPPNMIPQLQDGGADAMGRELAGYAI